MLLFLVVVRHSNHTPKRQRMHFGDHRVQSCCCAVSDSCCCAARAVSGIAVGGA
jgi:hypothetical protein